MLQTRKRTRFLLLLLILVMLNVHNSCSANQDNHGNHNNNDNKDEEQQQEEEEEERGKREGLFESKQKPPSPPRSAGDFFLTDPPQQRKTFNPTTTSKEHISIFLSSRNKTKLEDEAFKEGLIEKNSKVEEIDDEEAQNFWNKIRFDSNIDLEQVEIRRKIFSKRSKQIAALKQKMGTSRSFEIGVNLFSTMTNEERTLLTGLLPLPDRLSLNQEQSTSRIFSARAAGTSRLKSVDWRARGAVTNVKLQGLCGSCWAFAATGVMEAHFFKKNGYLVTLSEQELIDCDTKNNNGCRGGNFYYSFEDYYRTKKSFTAGPVYPYEGVQNSQLICPVLSRMFNFSTNFVSFVPSNEDALLDAIERGPVAVAVSGYSDVFQFYKGGVIDSNDCGTRPDHALLAVGYTQDYYIFKNSWGPSWGENGFVRIARGPGSTGKGFCGILTQVNEIIDEETNLSCDSSGTVCADLSSPNFCTKLYGCRETSFYASIDFSTGISGPSSDGKPTKDATTAGDEKNSQHTALIVSIVVSAVLAIGSAVLFFVWRRFKREDENNQLVSSNQQTLQRSNVDVSLSSSSSSSLTCNRLILKDSIASRPVHSESVEVVPEGYSPEEDFYDQESQVIKPSSLAYRRRSHSQVDFNSNQHQLDDPSSLNNNNNNNNNNNHHNFPALARRRRGSSTASATIVDVEVTMHYISQEETITTSN